MLFTLQRVLKKSLRKFLQVKKEKINKIFLQLKENPYVGDAIRYKFFREKRLREKRIYYLVYEELKIVLVVAISDKKTQKETIEEIIKLFPEFRNYAYNLFKN